MKLLLISSSRTDGTGFLDHCADAVRTHLGQVRRVLFVPHALADRESYAALVRERLQEWGYAVDSLHAAEDPRTAVEQAEAIFVGGGNSFRLLASLHELQLMPVLAEAVRGGTPYMGSSAGSNLACPTIRTTNDMPIVEPPSLSALNLIPFQINPHFIDADANSRHQGETRETRLTEYLEENSIPVLGIREGSWLVCSGNGSGHQCRLEGDAGAVLFRRDNTPLALGTGDLVPIAWT